jgi:hypothetical protein
MSTRESSAIPHRSSKDVTLLLRVLNHPQNLIPSLTTENLNQHREYHCQHKQKYEYQNVREKNLPKSNSKGYDILLVGLILQTIFYFFHYMHLLLM